VKTEKVLRSTSAEYTGDIYRVSGRKFVSGNGTLLEGGDEILPSLQDDVEIPQRVLHALLDLREVTLVLCEFVPKLRKVEKGSTFVPRTGRSASP
jgi:hypothetical protein